MLDALWRVLEALLDGEKDRDAVAVSVMVGVLVGTLDGGARERVPVPVFVFESEADAPIVAWDIVADVDVVPEYVLVELEVVD